MNVSKSSAGWRLSVLSRVVAASAGAYLLVNLCSMALGYLLPVEHFKALLFGMQISFLFYTVAIIWVFSVRSATKAWIGLIAVAIPLIIIDSFFYFRGDV